MGLDVFWGELLIYPFPMELSLNTCSHGCSYCFANLNKDPYFENPAQALRLLAECQERATLAARLVADRYPVAISNRCDPFSRSNADAILPILRVMAEMGVPVAILTKGGEGIDEALTFMPPSSWYVTVTTLDDAIRRAVEPGAPSVAERLALIEKLTQAGHTVTWGLNPLVPEWANLPAMFDALVARGVKGVWMQRLHLSYQQVRRMTPRQREGLGQAVIERAKDKLVAPELWDKITEAHELADAAGIPVWSYGQPFPSAFYDHLRALYARSFPVLQDWVNWCYANCEDGAIVTFRDFADALRLSDLPAGAYKMTDYIRIHTYTLWRTRAIPYDLTYEDVCKLIWAEPRVAQCPANLLPFAYIEEKGERVLDDEGLPLMVFDSQCFDTRSIEVERVEDASIAGS